MNWPFYHYIMSFFCVSCDCFWLEVYSVCISMVIPDLLGYHLHRIYFSILLAYICPYISNASLRQHIVGYCFFYSATFYLSTREFNPFTFKVIADRGMAWYCHFLNCFLCVLPVTLSFSFLTVFLVFHSFVCSDIVSFLSHFILLIFCSYSRDNKISYS